MAEKKKLLELIIEFLDNKLAEDIVTVDLTETSPFIDYFVICGANNIRKAHALKEQLLAFCDLNNIPYKLTKDSNESKWLIVDLKEIVVHIFTNDERETYNLEDLWKDLILKN